MLGRDNNKYSKKAVQKQAWTIDTMKETEPIFCLFIIIVVQS